MKRALIVGVDHYASAPLTGCVADATAIAGLLKRNSDESPNWSVNLVTSAAGNPGLVTRSSLRGHLSRLFDNSRDCDLLFFFSGHGASTLWGTEFVTQDAHAGSLGVSMDDLLTLANNSTAHSVTLILDCCFSGAAGNPTVLQDASAASAFRLSRALLREGVTVLAASGPMEVSVEEGGHGAFTRVLLEGLEGGASDHLGYVTTLSLYSYASPYFDAWRQQPTFKSHVTRPTLLRTGPPWIDVKLLRRLPEHFATADSRIRLTPAHEGAGRPLPAGTGSDEQRQFDYLGLLRNANLATSDNSVAFYWVAMEGGDVYLTPLGKYFWRLADRGAL
ncbi:MAG TPA: caspase family protein [Streptosporangiaceae bacterium]